MTIDERVDLFTRTLHAGTKHAVLIVNYRLTLLEVARDQRHACAEATMAVEGDSNNPWMIDKDAAHAAVMNTEIK